MLFYILYRPPAFLLSFSSLLLLLSFSSFALRSLPFLLLLVLFFRSSFPPPFSFRSPSFILFFVFIKSFLVHCFFFLFSHQTCHFILHFSYSIPSFHYSKFSFYVASSLSSFPETFPFLFTLSPPSQPPSSSLLFLPYFFFLLLFIETMLLCCFFVLFLLEIFLFLSTLPSPSSSPSSYLLLLFSYSIPCSFFYLLKLSFVLLLRFLPSL